MRDSEKYGLASALFAMAGTVLGLIARSKQRQETEKDKADFNDIATRIERSMNNDTRRT